MAPPQIGVFVGQFVFPPVVASDSPDNMLALREHDSREDGPNFFTHHTDYLMRKEVAAPVSAGVLTFRCLSRMLRGGAQTCFLFPCIFVSL